MFIQGVYIFSLVVLYFYLYMRYKTNMFYAFAEEKTGQLFIVCLLPFHYFRSMLDPAQILWQNRHCIRQMRKTILMIYVSRVLSSPT